MLFHLHRPRPPLDRFVELVTYYEGYDPFHSKEKLLPDGAVEIVVDLTDTPKRLYDRGDLARSVSFRNAWISGMRNDWIAIEAATGASMTVIRFRPGGAFPFLGFPAEAITDTVVELDAVLGGSGASLRDRILEAPTLPAKMVAVEAWLFERATGRLDANPVVEYVTGRLFAPAGFRISDVALEIGYSERHLLGLFRRWVGITPKQYGRIRRFQQVLNHVARKARISLPRTWSSGGVRPRNRTGRTSRCSTATTTNRTWPVTSASSPGSRPGATWPRSAGS